MADPMTIAAVVGAGAAAKSAFDPETGKQTTQIDPAQQAMYEDLYRRSQGIAAQPFIPYTGKRIAGFSPDQLRAFESTRGMFEAGQQYDPLGTLSQLGQQPTPGLLQADIGAYQSPYQQQVIDQSMADIQRQADIARQQAQSRAIGAGAFGGSRSALLESESQRPYIEQQEHQPHYDKLVLNRHKEPQNQTLKDRCEADSSRLVSNKIYLANNTEALDCLAVSVANNNSSNNGH